MSNLKVDLYRRPAGWDYVRMDVPGHPYPVGVYIRQAERGHIQLLFSAPKEIRIRGEQSGLGGPPKP
jgi:hypothetical protein